MGWFYENVYGCYYDTVGNLHWHGVYTGNHLIKHKGVLMTKKESVIEQRIKGHWVPELKDDGDSLLRCSICNYPVSYFWSSTNFCPECGADLRGKNNGKIKTEND